MSNEKLIHVKLEYEEALQAKKTILSTERDLLKIAKTIKNYRILRIEELKTKLKVFNKIKILNSEIRKLQKILPKIKIPNFINEKKEIEQDNFSKRLNEKKQQEYDVGLENQLSNIQRRLKELGG